MEEDKPIKDAWRYRKRGPYKKKPKYRLCQRHYNKNDPINTQIEREVTAHIKTLTNGEKVRYFSKAYHKLRAMLRKHFNPMDVILADGRRSARGGRLVHTFSLHYFGYHKFRELRRKELEREKMATDTELERKSNATVKELDALNKRIARTYRQMHPNKPVELSDLEHLDMSVQMLTKRIAVDAVTLGMDAPMTIADSEHRRMRMLQMEELRGMLSVTKGLRELRQWTFEEIKKRPMTFEQQPEELDALTQARDSLLKLGLDIDDIEDKEIINADNQDRPRTIS